MRTTSGVSAFCNYPSAFTWCHLLGQSRIGIAGVSRRPTCNNQGLFRKLYQSCRAIGQKFDQYMARAETRVSHTILYLQSLAFGHHFSQVTHPSVSCFLSSSSIFHYEAWIPSSCRCTFSFTNFAYAIGGFQSWRLCFYLPKFQGHVAHARISVRSS